MSEQFSAMLSLFTAILRSRAAASFRAAARAAGKDVVLVMLNPKAEASDATFNVNVKFKGTKLLAGDKFKTEHNRKTGDMTIHMPATSYAIVKLLNVK